MFVYEGVACAVLTYDLDVVDGRVVNLRLQVNPEKVAGLAGRPVDGASGM